MKLFSFLLVLASVICFLSLQSHGAYDEPRPAHNLIFENYAEATDFILDLQAEGHEVSYNGKLGPGFDVADFSISIGDINISIMICSGCNSGGGDSSGGSRRGAGGGAFDMVEPRV